MKILTSVFLLLMLLSSAYCITLDEYIHSEMEKQKIPGLSLAIVKAGKLVEAKGYGMANLEHQVLAKPETIYQSGSVGKQFTATGVMILVEEGKIKLDDPITNYFQPAPDAWKKITVRHLLNHTSGIPDYTEKDIDFRRDYTEADLLKVLQGLKLEFVPGEKWNYSNSGYMLLGFLIHKVTGKFYGDFLQERIFRPLQMNTTRIISEADIIPNRADGYELVDGAIKNQAWVAPLINTTADGSLYFTVLDLAKWDAALYGEKLLRTSSLQQMWTPVVLNNHVTYPYGFGWGFAFQRGHRIIQHSGHWQGFSTSICRYVDDQLTVILLCNLGGVGTTAIANHIAGLYESSLISPRFLQPQTDPNPSQTESIKTVLAAIAKGQQPFPWPITDSAKKELSERVAKLKKLKSFEYVTCDDVFSKEIHLYGTKINRFCYYKISNDQERHWTTFALDMNQTVVELSIDSDD